MDIVISVRRLVSSPTQLMRKGKLRFNSIADGRTTRAKRGCTSYTIIRPRTTNNRQTHWIFYKDVSKDQQITEGFLTKELYQEVQEQRYRCSVTNFFSEEATASSVGYKPLPKPNHLLHIIQNRSTPMP